MVDSLHGDKEIATRPMDGVAARQLCRDQNPCLTGSLVAIYPAASLLSAG
jgi:hypothetical protein